MEKISQQKAGCSDPETSVSRQMVWNKTPHIEAWTCCACAWVFRPSGPPLGISLDDMICNYELQRDREYANHVCAEHCGAKKAEDNSTFSGRFDDRPYRSSAASRATRKEIRRAS